MRLSIYGYDQPPSTAVPVRHVLLFEDLIDLSDLVHYIAHAKAQVYLRHLHLEQQLVEVQALQITYIRILSSTIADNTAEYASPVREFSSPDMSDHSE